MGQEEDVQKREQEARVYRRGLELGDTLVRTVQETVERGLEELVAKRAEMNAATRGLVAAIEITDKSIHKASGDWGMDLRRQRQQLVDALCDLSGAKPKEAP